MLVLVGLNHRSAPLAVREKLAFPEEEIPAALDRLRDSGVAREAMILSTCNRVEILVRTDDGKGVSAVKQFLAEDRKIGAEDLAKYTYDYVGAEAVRHVFHVAAGLDSMILGEPQILGQVKRAYRVSKAAGGTASILDHLLQQGLAAAKRVRTDTGISRHAVSVAFAAVELARKIFGELEGRSVLVLGAGKMTDLALTHLTSAGVGGVVVSNRTYSRAVRLAERFEGTPVNWDEGFDHLERVDIVVTGTAAPEPILDKARVQKALKARRSRPLFLIDIAVPRDVATDVNDLDNVYLYDIDDLQGVVDANLEERRRAAEEAARMIDVEVESFERWLQSLEVAPTISALRRTLHGLGTREIDRFRRRLGPLTPGQERVVEELTRAVIQKILHPPIRHLKERAGRGDWAATASLYQEIFGMPSEAGERPDPDAKPRSSEAPATGPRRVLRGGKDST